MAKLKDLGEWGSHLVRSGPTVHASPSLYEATADASCLLGHYLLWKEERTMPPPWPHPPCTCAWGCQIAWLPSRSQATMGLGAFAQAGPWLGYLPFSILHLANFYSSFITQLRGCLLQEAFPDHFPDRPDWAGCLLWVSTCPPVLCRGVARVLLGGCSLHLTRPFQNGDVWAGLPGGSPGQGTAWGRLGL